MKLKCRPYGAQSELGFCLLPKYRPAGAEWLLESVSRILYKAETNVSISDLEYIQRIFISLSSGHFTLIYIFLKFIKPCRGNNLVDKRFLF